MIRILLAVVSLLVALPSQAQELSFPSQFAVKEITANDATIYVRVGGHGPAVVLLHGYGETGDMWVPMAIDFARNHTVIVPDLRRARSVIEAIRWVR